MALPHAPGGNPCPHLLVYVLDRHGPSLLKSGLVVLTLLPSLLSQLHQLLLPRAQLRHLTQLTLLQTLLHTNQLTLHLTRGCTTLPHSTHSRISIGLNDLAGDCFILFLIWTISTFKRDRSNSRYSTIFRSEMERKDLTSLAIILLALSSLLRAEALLAADAILSEKLAYLSRSSYLAAL